MVTMETTVVTAMAEDKMVVSIPFFSACIIGRLPTGTAAMRHMPRMAVLSKDKACITMITSTGKRISLSTMNAHIREFAKASLIRDLDTDTPRRTMERKTVAFPMYPTVFEIIGGGVMPNQKMARLKRAITVPGLNTWSG